MLGGEPIWLAWPNEDIPCFSCTWDNHCFPLHQDQCVDPVLYSSTMIFPGPLSSHPAGLQFSDRQACCGCLRCNARHPDIFVAFVAINVCRSAHHICRATRITILADMCLKVGYYQAMPFEAGSYPTFQPFVWRVVWDDAERHG